MCAQDVFIVVMEKEKEKGKLLVCKKKNNKDLCKICI